jgi:serine/threonine protein kinase
MDSPFIVRAEKIQTMYNGMRPIVVNDVLIYQYSYIVFTYYKNGSLIDFIMRADTVHNLTLSVHMKKYLCEQLILMVDFLHNVNGLAHLDIKPDNVIIKDDFSLAFIDFGHSAPINLPV